MATAVAASRIDEIHAASKIEEVDLAKLKVDHSYQRDTSESLVDIIANDWDVVASELILVSNRGTRPKDGDVEGGLYVVNGQHRSKAAQKRGMDKIWARVIDLRKEKDPAKIEANFRLKTNVRLGDRPLERFKAQLRAGDPESIAIKNLLDRFDTEINLTIQNDVGINAVATIEGLYRIDEGATLQDTLQIVKDTWTVVGGKQTSAALLKGLAWFIDKHAEESDRTRFVSKLKTLGLAALESRARTTGLTLGGSLWLNYYRAMVDLYNEQLREKNRLQWMTRGSRRLDTGGGSERAA